MKAVCFSDSHMNFPMISPAKYLFFAGDYQSGYHTSDKSKEIATAFLKWLGRQPNQFKVMVPGNHDSHFFEDPESFKSIAKENNVIVLDNEIVNVGGLRVFGSPYFYTCRLNRFLIVDFPNNDDFDLMITHVPPYGVFDFNPKTINNIGSPDLRDYIEQNKVKCHIFGHAHEGHCSANPFHNVAITSGGKKKTMIRKPYEMSIDHLCL